MFSEFIKLTQHGEVSKSIIEVSFLSEIPKNGDKVAGTFNFFFFFKTFFYL